MEIEASAPPGVAVIGCGLWGRNLVRVMNSLGALRAVVDSSPEGRATAQELAPDIPVYAGLEALERPDVNAAVIVTPAVTHAELALGAIAAGCDVFVEKPLATDLHAARRVHEAAEASGRVLMVGHLLEYHPAILTLLDLVRTGKLGKVRYIISNRLNLGRVRSEENALWSFAPHDVSVILRLVGSMPVQVVATGGGYVQPNIADVTVTQFLFDDGVRSHVFVSWLHPFKEQRLVVIGSDRMASYDDVEKKLVLYDQRVDVERGQPIPVRGDGTELAFPDEEPLVAECRHFLDRLRDRERPRTDGANGLRVLRVLEAAQRSLVMNGEPVTLGLEAR